MCHVCTGVIFYLQHGNLDYPRLCHAPCKMSDVPYRYTSVDGELNMQLTTLYFFCNRPTIGALMGIGTDLSAALARKPVDAPAASVGTETGGSQGEEEPGKQRDLQASELSKAPSAQPGAGQNWG